MINAVDMDHCREAIRHGSRSFHTAGRLLPAKVRDPALALYAFCRLADDAVDLTEEKADAVLRLHDRLSLVYEGRPRNAPQDRAFAAVVEDFQMPRALPEALLEGLAWDAEGRWYEDLSALTAYSARVASAVGAMMCVLMRVRDRDVLARACDLGVAMQLTNIARDVAEDAEEGRLYLPLEWLREARIDPHAFLNAPGAAPELIGVVRRLLDTAGWLYARSETGVKGLPAAARPGIFAARYIYAGIGRQLRRADCDPFRGRAHTSGGQKVMWLMLSAMRAAGTSIMPRSALIYAPPLPETAFLVEAAAAPETALRGWSETLIETMAHLAEQDQRRKARLMPERRSSTSLI